MAYHKTTTASSISDSSNNGIGILKRPKTRKRRRHPYYSNSTPASFVVILETIIMVATICSHLRLNSIGSSSRRKFFFSSCKLPMMADAFTTTSYSLVSSSSVTAANNDGGRLFSNHQQQQRKRNPSQFINRIRRIQQHSSSSTFSEPVTLTMSTTPTRLFSTRSADESESASTTETATSAAADTDTDTSSIDTLHANWKESLLVNPTITFDTLMVPASQLTKWITHPQLQHRLAKPDNWEFLKHVHPRIKLVQDAVVCNDNNNNNNNDDDGATNDNSNNNKNNNKRYKQLLLLPSSVLHENSNHTATGMPAGGSDRDEDKWLSNLLSSLSSEKDNNTSEKEDTASSTATLTIRKGPPRVMPISYKQLSFQYILKRLLPESAFPLPSSYEQIGHVAHFNLKPKHVPFRKLIGDVLIESTSSDSIQTVVNKVGQVDGKFRTYECEILADVFVKNNSSGDDDDNISSSSSSLSSLETTVVEDGVSIQLNVAECYWCTRLSGERQELIKDILKRSKSTMKRGEPLVVADVFCGAGAVCMLIAKKVKDQQKLKLQQQQQQQKKKNQKKTTQKKKDEEQQPSTYTYTSTTEQQSTTTTPLPPLLTVLANDWNPTAIEYMKRSIKGNGMDKEKDESIHKFELSCHDSYDFLFELGEEKQHDKVNPYDKIRRKKKEASATKEEEPKRCSAPPLPDHVLMNFPLEAPKFLGALRWWSWKRLEQERKRRKDEKWFPRFHVYTFARSSSSSSSSSSSYNNANDEEEMAANIIANELLPPIADDANSSDNNEDDVTTTYRREEFNEEFKTDMSTRMVRDVAPGKVVVCVSFNVTPKLIRYMQGDYS